MSANGARPDAGAHTVGLAPPASGPLTASGTLLARVSLLLIGLGLLCLPFADLAIYRVEPWTELQRMLSGLLRPDWHNWPSLLRALVQTVAFALLAVAASSVLGLLLALWFQWRPVRLFCASIRAVHELFWGLIFMQVFGLSALTGLLAILVPYSGVFARVYAEILERQSPLPGATLPPGADRFSRYAYTLLPQAWGELVSYTRYRFECALRSSTVLGFIGLPTLGFYLDTAFKQGQYHQAASALLLFFALIASIRYWLRPRLLPLLLLLALWFLPESPAVDSGYLWQFISRDIWPGPVLAGDFSGSVQWYVQQLGEVALPAIANTLVLSQLALVLTGLLALLSYGWASAALVVKPVYLLGHAFLLVMRSTPEMVFAFILLLLFGPSGLPAVLALALHNGGLIAFLLAAKSDQLRLRLDAPTGLNRYFYEVTPRIYSGFIALLLYRWEVILRESAILGILGLTTLGFYIDSAFEDIRYDRAMLLITVTALLNILVDSFARRLRRYCETQSLTASSWERE
jgi:phosphonate transport system permease protein